MPLGGNILQVLLLWTDARCGPLSGVVDRVVVGPVREDLAAADIEPQPQLLEHGLLEADEVTRLDGQLGEGGQQVFMCRADVLKGRRTSRARRPLTSIRVYSSHGASV